MYMGCFVTNILPVWNDPYMGYAFLLIPVHIRQAFGITLCRERVTMNVRQRLSHNREKRDNEAGLYFIHSLLSCACHPKREAYTGTG